MAKTILGICSGNSGRSPIFQLVGNNHLEDIGKNNDFQVHSAGSMVDVFRRGEYSLDSMKSYIELARKRGDVYTPSEEARLDEAVANRDTDTAKTLFMNLIHIFHSEEISNRAAAIRHFGLRNDFRLQTLPQQFQVIPDRNSKQNPDAVITMDERNKGIIRTCYHQSPVPEPYIEVLNKVPGNIGKTLNANAFGGTRQDYFTVFEQVINQTPVAIDYIVKNFSR